MTLNERIEKLENLVEVLRAKIRDLSKNTEEKDIKPYSEVAHSEKLDNMDGTFIKGIWVAKVREVDVESVYLVKRATDGTIEKDSNGVEMKSPLLFTSSILGGIPGDNENLLKSNIVWDEDAKCWRFYGVFKPLPEV